MATPVIPVEVTPPSSAAVSIVASVWPVWQRVLFRFFSVYLLLQIAPWGWFRIIPGITGLLLSNIQWVINWAVSVSNAHLFHVRDVLIRPNGSGDTSWAWAQMWLYLVLAAIACVVWSVLDRKRANYTRALYWLRLVVRYYIATFALSYGIIKLFALQMTFPALSQLATPLGDLLPMRFSWLFIGYSLPYQIFSGVMETTAGLVLLNNRTVTAGLFAATGAFTNVVMINLSYDVPVKLFASHLLFSCLFLLVLDSPRLVNLLVLNRPASATSAYDSPFARFGWPWWVATGVKVFFLYQILYVPLTGGYTRYKAANATLPPGPFKTGIYDVKAYVVNRDTVPVTAGDTLRWKDVIFDSNAGGSIGTADATFWQRYHRGYFRYRPDTGNHTVTVWKISAIPRDSTFLFTMRYESPDTNTIRFHTVIRGDSIHVELIRMPRHFQLTERQFHWVSEYNR